MQALEGLGDCFAAQGIAGPRWMDDGKSLAPEGECERLASVADFFEKSEAAGFELGNLQGFYKRKFLGLHARQWVLDDDGFTLLLNGLDQLGETAFGLTHIGSDHC